MRKWSAIGAQGDPIDRRSRWLPPDQHMPGVARLGDAWAVLVAPADDRRAARAVLLPIPPGLAAEPSSTPRGRRIDDA